MPPTYASGGTHGGVGTAATVASSDADSVALTAAAVAEGVAVGAIQQSRRSRRSRRMYGTCRARAAVRGPKGQGTAARAKANLISLLTFGLVLLVAHGFARFGPSFSIKVVRGGCVILLKFRQDVE